MVPHHGQRCRRIAGVPGRQLVAPRNGRPQSGQRANSGTWVMGGSSGTAGLFPAAGNGTRGQVPGGSTGQVPGQAKRAADWTRPG